MRRVVSSIAVALLVLPACGKKTESVSGSASATSAHAASYNCKVFISKKPAAPVQGSATDADEAKATEAAWKDACSKLAAADQPDCRNKDKWSPAISNGSITVNHKKSSTITIKLEQNTPRLTGKGESTSSEDDACKHATDDACKQAGTAGDCVASGGFVLQGKSIVQTSGGSRP